MKNTIAVNLKRSADIIFCLVFFISCRTDDSDAAKKEENSVVLSADPLPSWNTSELKKSILDFVSRITKEGSVDFVPERSRIATFDNDGTLWAEKPYVQELFAFYRVKKMVADKPGLARRQPFKAVIEGDKTFFSKGGDKALIQLVALTHTGLTEDAFEKEAQDFFQSAVYPGRNVPLSKITYKPQLELMDYLRAHGFKIFIVTGGTIELVRAIAPVLYGVPKEQVVGTTFKYKYLDSSGMIMREPAISLLNDKDGKPVGIQTHIGQRPLFACGNEGGKGDIAMLRYSQGNKYPSFQLLINHDDASREYAYQENDSASLKAAAKFGWHVVSMKNDWKTIFQQ